MKSSEPYHRANFVANILCAAVGVSLIGLLAYKSLSEEFHNAHETPLIGVGEDFTGLQEINFSKHRNNVLLAMDTECSYCVTSIPLYKKIISKRNQNPNIRVIALFDESKADVRAFLDRYEIDLEFISNADLTMARIDMTPTIILVNDTRMIMASYEGMLPESQEQYLLEILERESSVDDSGHWIVEKQGVNK